MRINAGPIGLKIHRKRWEWQEASTGAGIVRARDSIVIATDSRTHTGCYRRKQWLGA